MAAEWITVGKRLADLIQREEANEQDRLDLAEERRELEREFVRLSGKPVRESIPVPVARPDLDLGGTTYRFADTLTALSAPVPCRGAELGCVVAQQGLPHIHTADGKIL